MSQLGIVLFHLEGSKGSLPAASPEQAVWLISSHCMCVLEEVQKRFTRVSVVPLVKIADKHMKKPQNLAGFI